MFLRAFYQDLWKYLIMPVACYGTTTYSSDDIIMPPPIPLLPNAHHSAFYRSAQPSVSSSESYYQFIPHRCLPSSAFPLPHPSSSATPYYSILNRIVFGSGDTPADYLDEALEVPIVKSAYTLAMRSAGNSYGYDATDDSMNCTYSISATNNLQNTILIKEWGLLGGSGDVSYSNMGEYELLKVFNADGTQIGIQNKGSLIYREVLDEAFEWGAGETIVITINLKYRGCTPSDTVADIFSIQAAIE